MKTKNKKMKIDREELIRAIKFIKPAILMTEQEDTRNYVHVKIEAGKMQLTACNGYCGKRAILVQSTQIDFMEQQEEREGEFLINKPTLESFETLCTKHKAIFEKAAKADASLKLVEIKDNELISCRDSISYNQPIGHYPDIDRFFQYNRASTDRLLVDPKIMLDIFKEFGHGAVEINFSGEIDPVYVQQGDLTYQAFFMPCGEQ